jgi:hypothetical protein
MKAVTDRVRVVLFAIAIALIGIYSPKYALQLTADALDV